VWLAYSVGIILIVALAALIPHGAMWGVDNFKYLPLWLSGLLLAGTLFALFNRHRKSREKAVAKPARNRTKYIVLVAIVSFTIFYKAPIATTIYGDEVQISKESVSGFNATWFSDITAPNLLQGKEALTMAIHRSLAVILSMPLTGVFRLVSALCGAAFVALWTAFLLKSELRREFQLALFATAVTGGGMLVFFGHVEVYALPILGAMVFLLYGLRVLNHKRSFWLLLALFVVIVKLHIVNILFLPALLYIFFEGRKARLQDTIRWRNILLWLVTPTLLIGLGSYFFLFHSYNEPYVGDKTHQLQQSFLPLTLSPPPFNHYSLLAPAHLLDLFNVFLFIAAPVIVLLIGLLFLARRSVDWNSSLVKYCSLAVLFPLIFFCAMNPTLSIGRDWDIYSLIYPPLLLSLFVVALAISKSADWSTAVSQYASRSALAFGLLALPAIIVNVSPSLIASKLFDLSDHVYRTYYAGSHYLMSAGLETAGNNDRATKLAKLVQSIRTVHQGVADEDGAGMLMWRAKLYLEEQQLDSAYLLLKEAHAWDPRQLAVLVSLETVSKALGDTAATYSYLQELVKRDPSKENIERLQHLH
jgi:tetratricopeptide (TPR) repeat protein